MMKIKIFCIWIFCVLAFNVSGTQLDLPTKTINGKQYYYYVVSKHETLYGVSIKLNVSKEYIIKNNPTTYNGLQSNQVLLFPYDNGKEYKITNTDTQKYINHIVRKGETLYNLSKVYNVTTDEIIALNSSATNGIKIDETLRIPIKSNNHNTTTTQPTAKKSKYTFHNIAKGETLYALSKRYNTSIESIIKENPGVSPTQFKVGEVLRIIEGAPTEKTPDVTLTQYEVKKKESIKEVATRHGISVDSIKSLNPGIGKKIKEGDKIFIASSIEPEKEDIAYTLIDETSAVVDNKLSIAVLLPFRLNESVSQKSSLYTEFYEGFLLALNEQRNNSKDITIYTYDTEDSLNKVDSILGLSELKNVNLIIEPDDETQISHINRFALENKINAVNAFSLKNEDYFNNEYLYQANIPHEYLYNNAIAQFGKLYSNHTVVFLINENDQNDKDTFLSELKSYLTENHIQSIDFNFNGKIDKELLSNVLPDNKEIVFVPSSAKRQTINLIGKSLVSIKKERTDLTISLFGYPEWITYKDQYPTLHSLNTYIYSRIFLDTTSSKYKEFNLKFKNWYGKDLISAAPVFGILGYDLGNYFLHLLIKNGNIKADSISKTGIQTDYRYERVSNWSGFINKSFYFINYTTDNTIRSIKL